MKKTVNSFIKNESGAVIVDWVILTAAVVGFGMAVISVVSGGVNAPSASINAQTSVAVQGGAAP